MPVRRKRDGPSAHRTALSWHLPKPCQSLVECHASHTQPAFLPPRPVPRRLPVGLPTLLCAMQKKKLNQKRVDLGCSISTEHNAFGLFANRLNILACAGTRRKPRCTISQWGLCLLHLLPTTLLPPPSPAVRSTHTLMPRSHTDGGMPRGSRPILRLVIGNRQGPAPTFTWRQTLGLSFPDKKIRADDAPVSARQQYTARVQS